MSANRPRHRILNVWVDDVSISELAENFHSGTLFTINPDHLYHLQRNAEFFEAYSHASVVSCDSRYVFLALRFLGRPIRETAPGSDIFPAYWRHHAANSDTTIFLLGAKPGIADRARERINELAGREIIVGAHGPSFHFVNDAVECSKVVEMINRSGATCLVVGLGAPKQEIWIHKHRHRMPGVKVFMAMGATIDYEAQAVKRAPPWMRHGLEWVYRVLTEPRRYGLRYLRNSEFAWLVLLDRFGLYRPPLEAPAARQFPAGTADSSPQDALTDLKLRD